MTAKATRTIDPRRIAGSAFQYDRVETDPAVTYVLDPQLTIAYCNLSWNRFALENGAPQIVREKIIGLPVLNVIADTLRGFYRNAYAGVQGTKQPWEHDYECSSAQHYRMMHMRVLPLSGGFLMIENSLSVIKPHSPGPGETGVQSYKDELGVIMMCAHCRRVRYPQSQRWDWIPAFIAKLPENTSHGLCENCRTFYFGC